MYRFFALGRGKRVAVVEDVGAFCDVEGAAHLGEHVVLLDAGEVSVGVEQDEGDCVREGGIKCLPPCVHLKRLA